MLLELTEVYSLEGSAYTPKYNPHILPLTTSVALQNYQKKFESLFRKSIQSALKAIRISLLKIQT